jgi:modulator of FtsH protease HflC
MKKKLFLVIFILSVAIVIPAAFSFYVVGEHRLVIITRFGKPVRTVSESGLYLKMPGFIDKVNRFDKRVAIFETEPIQLLLSDKNPIIISSYVVWKIDSPLLFFQSVGNNVNAESKLTDMVNSFMGIILGDYSGSNIINTKAEEVKLSEIEKRVAEETNKNAIEKYGLRVIKTGIKRVSYPSVVTKAVYNRMKSERQKEAEKIKAEGMEEAAKITTAADKEANEIKAEAEREALVIRGEGDSESMRIYNSAFSKDPELFNFLQSLESYEKMLEKNTTIILSTDSPLLKYLNIDPDK